MFQILFFLKKQTTDFQHFKTDKAVFYTNQTKKTFTCLANIKTCR